MTQPSAFDKSLVLLFSAVAKGVFGTGFIVEQTGDATRIVTCRHVVRDIAKSLRNDSSVVSPTVGQIVENLRIAGTEEAEVTLLAIGRDDAVDIAVLEVKPPLLEPALSISCQRISDSVILEGHSAERSGTYLRKPAEAEVPFHVDQISMTTGEIVAGWQLVIRPGFALHGGFSGSPVMDTGSGAIFGVANAKSTDGSTGLVIELSNLTRMWPHAKNLFVENRTILFSHPDDSAVAEELVLALKKNVPSGVDLHVWRDRPIDTFIAAAANCLLVLWTEPLSTHCAQLVETSIRIRKAAAHKPIVPVSITGSPPPGVLEHLVPQNVWCNYLTPNDLNRLVWSITGENPAPPDVVPPLADLSSLPPVNKALNALTDHLNSGAVTFVVGCANPAESQVATKLFMSAGIPSNAQFFPLDFTGTCFSFWKNDTDLDDEMRLVHKLDTFPDTYEDLCRIIRKGMYRQLRRLNAPVQPQLIVTTNLDSALEVSLLHAGIPFMRIVHDRSSVVLHVSEYDDQDAQMTAGKSLLDILKYAAEVPVTAVKRTTERHNEGKIQDALQNLSLGAAKVVLYKLVGSIDIRQSAVLTAEQLFAHIPSLQNQSATPVAITCILNRTNLLMLGYSHLDLSFRVVQQFLSKVDARFERFFVQPKPPPGTTDPLRLLEEICWTGITDRRLKEMSVMTVPQSPNAFVKDLAKRVTGGEHV